MYGDPSMQTGGYGGYGATHSFGGELGSIPLAAKPTPFVRRHRPSNFVSIFVCFLMPVVIFSGVYSLQCFSFHYTDPKACKSLSFMFLGLVALFGIAMVSSWRRRDDGATDPKWYTFLFVTSLTGWICGMVFGARNFSANISPYLDIMNLNVYPNIDPSKYTGQQLMDAGRIFFTPETHLDLGHSMGFRNLDTYCVAPITSPSANSSGTPTFDFWAIGINCCSGHLPDFHCGEFNNLNAKSGLRLMRDDQRAYFRLAVQQAEAAYNIRAPHPIFMLWMQDPMSEISVYHDDGYKFWIIGVSVFAGVQLILLVIAGFAFWKAGI